MPELQESVTRSDVDARAPQAASTQRVGKDSDKITWGRVDWARPVGYFNDVSMTRMESTLQHRPFVWTLKRINKLWLEHRAAILLLQGKPLSALLIPNQAIRASGSKLIHNFAHVLLRVDPWEYWQSAPVLTNLVLAQLGDIPAGLSSAEVLAELAERSSALT